MKDSKIYKDELQSSFNLLKKKVNVVNVIIWFLIKE